MLGSAIYSKIRWPFCLIAILAMAFSASIAHAQAVPVDCSSYVTVSTANERSVLDPRTRKITSTADVTIKNTSSAGKSLLSPLHAVISINNANGTVTMPDALGGPGTEPYGKYYFDLSGNLGNLVLLPGATVSFSVKFVRASTVRFTYAVSTYAVMHADNQPPVANAGQNRTVAIPPGQDTVDVQLDGSASSDPDGSIAAYTWSGPGNPAGAAQPTVSLGEGNHEYTLVVTDNTGASSAPASVMISVGRAHPPQLSINPLAYSVDQGDTLTFFASATSPDGRNVTLAAGPAIDNASFKATSGPDAAGTFTFSPDSGQTGKFLVNFKARDALGLLDSKTVQITVNKINHPPSLSLPATASVKEGQSLAIPATALDPDGDTLAFTTSPLPANTIFIPATGTLVMTPDYNQSGSYSVTLTASDGSQSAAATVQITVVDVPVGSEPGASGLTLQVDPVESPTFLTTQRVTGTVNRGGGQAPVPAAKSALITGLSPATAEQGDTLDVVLTGDSGTYPTHFVDGVSKADFGEGITVNSLTITGFNSASANITVSSGAAVGARSVNILTANETAVSVLAFNIAKGTTSITGRIVDEETGAGIPGAVVLIQGTILSTITDSNGNFTLIGAPSGQQTLMVNPPNHESIIVPMAAEVGVDQALGEIKTASTVFDSSAPSGASLGSLLSRIYVDSRDTRSFAELEQTVIDAVQYVGGRDLGVLDEYGNELNPTVTETPFLRLKPGAVSSIALRTKIDSPVTLGELLWQFTQMFRWKDGEGYVGKPTLAHWIHALQQTVNTAWSKPKDPASRLFLLLFNTGKNLSPQPPTISPNIPLNELQASLLRFSLFALGARAIEPDDVLSQLPEGYFEGEEIVARGSEPARALLAELIVNHPFLAAAMPPPAVFFQSGGGGTGQVLIAKAARSKENAYIGKELVLDGTSSRISSGLNVNFEWSVTSSPTGSAGNQRFRYGGADLLQARKRIVFFNPDEAGEYTIQLVLKTSDGTLASDPYEITVVARHWPCDPRGLDPEWEDEEVVNMDRPWQNVLCTMGSEKAVDILKTELGSLVSEFDIPEVPSSAYEEWASKGTIAGDVTSRLKAEKNFMRFFQNDAKHSATIRSYAQAYEKYLPQIMESAKEEPPSISKEIKGMVVKELVTGTLSYFKDQADKLGESIMYAFLDKIIDRLIDSLRPSPPFVHHVDVLDAEHDPNKKIAIVFFNRAAEDPGPEGKKAICAGLSPDDTSAAAQKSRTRCNSDFFYRLVREHGNEVTKYPYYPEGENVTNGPVPTNDGPGGEPLFFVDYNPPEGHVRYYVQARRIIGQHTVPSTTMWNEAEFFVTNYVVGGVCPPAAAQYNFSKGLMERFLKILSEVKMQDSDLGTPEIVYVPRPFERPSPPVSLAADPVGRISVSVPLAGSVFSLKGGNLDFAFNTGFKDPHQVGLAIDALGYHYSVNAASEAQFGGRIFRWKPISYEREFFGAQQYYSRDLGYAHPSATQSMYAGMNFGQHRLFLTDLYSNSLKYLNIPNGGALPPGDLFHNVAQPIAQSPTIAPNAQSSMTTRQGMDLLMTQGDNIFRYLHAGDQGMLFDSYKPFVSLSGIDADMFGNVYVADAGLGDGQGTITALPRDKQNDAFYQELIEDEGTRSLYTLVSGLTSPGDLRVGSQGTSLVWFDRKGFNSRQFGLSARILDSATGHPLAFAIVSAEGNGITTDGKTDGNGILHLPGLLTPTAAPPSVSLLIRDSLGRTMTVRINSLDRSGETFIDPLIFVPEIAPPPPSLAPPTPTPPESTVVPGITITGADVPNPLLTPINPGSLPPVAPPDVPTSLATAQAPRVRLVAPVDGLQTANTSISFFGTVSDPSITTARINVNGIESSVSVIGGRFSGTAELNAGINSISASASKTVESATLSGNSGVSYVERIDTPPVKSALSGIVVDENTGYPVANVRVMIQGTGLYAYTDSMGVWFIEDVPNGSYDVEIVP
jgi:hypothetical protein